jgi:hypothetical protein
MNPSPPPLVQILPFSYSRAAKLRYLDRRKPSTRLPSRKASIWNCMKLHKSIRRPLCQQHLPPRIAGINGGKAGIGAQRGAAARVLVAWILWFFFFGRGNGCPCQLCTAAVSATNKIRRPTPVRQSTEIGERSSGARVRAKISYLRTQTNVSEEGTPASRAWLGWASLPLSLGIVREQSPR